MLAGDTAVRLAAHPPSGSPSSLPSASRLCLHFCLVVKVFDSDELCDFLKAVLGLPSRIWAHLERGVCHGQLGYHSGGSEGGRMGCCGRT